MKLQYIKRSINGTIVVYDNHIEEYNNAPVHIINKLCMEYGSTYKGRVQSVARKYSIKRKVPIYVNKDVLLIPTGSNRDYETYWLNYHQIMEVNADYITMQNGDKLHSGAKITNRQLKKCFEIAF